MFKFRQSSMQQLMRNLRLVEDAFPAMALEAARAGAESIKKAVQDLPWMEHPSWAGSPKIGKHWMAPQRPMRRFAHGAPGVGRAPVVYGGSEMPFKRSGELVDSFEVAAWNEPGSAHAAAFTDKDYAVGLEIGTREGELSIPGLEHQHVGPYPFFWPATEGAVESGEVLGAMRAAMQKGWADTVARIA